MAGAKRLLSVELRRSVPRSWLRNLREFTYLWLSRTDRPQIYPQWFTFTDRSVCLKLCKVWAKGFFVDITAFLQVGVTGICGLAVFAGQQLSLDVQ